MAKKDETPVQGNGKNFVQSVLDDASKWEREVERLQPAKDIIYSGTVGNELDIFRVLVEHYDPREVKKMMEKNENGERNISTMINSAKANASFNRKLGDELMKNPLPEKAGFAAKIEAEKSKKTEVQK